MRRRDVVVIGAGHAGVALCAELRRIGFSGSIALINGEPAVPYQRPPLSKAWLTGLVDAEEGRLQPDAFYAGNAIDRLDGCRVTGLDLSDGVVTTTSGRLPFENVVLATGSRARRLGLPGENADGVVALEDARSAASMRDRLAPGVRVVVVGAGYLGLEVAASATAHGARVAVVHRAPRVLSRVASPELAADIAELHRDHGERLLLDATVAEFDVRGERIRGVRDSRDRYLPADLVVTAVGARPNDELARAAGLPCDDGVLVDAQGRAADRVFAIGDVARRPRDRWGAQRLESVHDANEDARIVAAAIAGHPIPPSEVPWFWSDQFASKVQIAGLRDDRAAVVARRYDGGPRAYFHLLGDELIAVEALDSSRDFALGRRIVAERGRVDAAALADPSIPLRQAQRVVA